jgi:hypothetical protein
MVLDARLGVVEQLYCPAIDSREMRVIADEKQ